MRSKQLSRAHAAVKGVGAFASKKPSSLPRRTSVAAGRPPGENCVCSPVDDAIARFEYYLNEHSLSPVTVRNYLADLRAFSRWHAASCAGAEALDPSHFQAYREYLCHESKRSTATVNRRLQSLRLFGRFLSEVGQIPVNPTRELALIPSNNGNGSSPRTLSRSEIALLVQAVRAGRPSLVARDHAITQLMLQAGLRVHEVAGLRRGDVEATGQRIRLHIGGTRRNGHRVIPLNAAAAHAVREYLAIRPAIPEVEQLFLSQRGLALSLRSIQRIVDTHARAAGLKGVCAQSLRHTCARRLWEETRDAELVARRLGQSLRALGRYFR